MSTNYIFPSLFSKLGVFEKINPLVIKRMARGQMDVSTDVYNVCRAYPVKKGQINNICSQYGKMTLGGDLAAIKEGMDI